MRAAAGPRPTDEFVLFSGARLNAIKRSKDILALYDRVWQAGLPARVEVTTPTAQAIGEQVLGGALVDALRARPGITVRYQCHRAEYLEVAARAHACVVWSRSEGAPIGFIEQLYVGVVGCFPRLPWAERFFLPPDYPWFFSGAAEAVACRQGIARDYPSCAERLERYRPWMREHFSRRATWDLVRADLAQRIAGGGHAMPTKGIAELVDTVAGPARGVHADDAVWADRAGEPVVQADAPAAAVVDRADLDGRAPPLAPPARLPGSVRRPAPALPKPAAETDASAGAAR